ncbi:hypothetical protein BTJ45_04371 [Bacillus mycoides]|nr:hypothetical protein BTJ45_04371 [Bacillus mycoides]
MLFNIAKIKAFDFRFRELCKYETPSASKLEGFFLDTLNTDK